MMRPAEQPAGQQHQRRQNPHQLDGQQVDGHPQALSEEERQAYHAFQRGDEPEDQAVGEEAERQPARSHPEEILGRADAGETLQYAEAEEDHADADTQQRDAVPISPSMDGSLERDQPLVQAHDCSVALLQVLRNSEGKWFGQARKEARVGSADTVDIADAPRIGGLSFRRFRGDTDHGHLLAITNTCLEADDAENLQTLDSVVNIYRVTRTFDPREHVVFAEVVGGDAPIAYSRIRAQQPQADGSRSYESWGTCCHGGDGAGSAL